MDFDVTFDAHGVATGFTSGDGGALPADLAQCLQDFFAQYCFTSFAGTTVASSTHCWIA
jgi:hypothetical protein